MPLRWRKRKKDLKSAIEWLRRKFESEFGRIRTRNRVARPDEPPIDLPLDQGRGRHLSYIGAKTFFKNDYICAVVSHLHDISCLTVHIAPFEQHLVCGGSCAIVG